MSTKLIAFDQSLNITGYSIFVDDVLVSYDKFDTSNGVDTSIKLKEIRDIISSLLDEQKPNQIAFEEIQLQQIPGSSAHGNVETFKKLAYVQAIFLEICAERQLEYSIVPSVSWKSTCGIKGRGRAEQKKNAQVYVLHEYGIKPIQDIVDSICIGMHVIEEANKETNWE
ncbi:hypothetical protein [Clostridium sp.]|uniref:hypothetical protein n=1 Tax=Clostridium sp. TaxID=1506 RepID=UPI002FC8B06F